MSAEKGPVYPYRSSERWVSNKEPKGKTIRWVLIVVIGMLALLSQVVTKPDLFPYKDIKMSIPSRPISPTFLFSSPHPSPITPSDDLASSSSSNSPSDSFYKRSFSFPTSFTTSFGNWKVNWSKENETLMIGSVPASGLRNAGLLRFLEHGRWSLMERPTYHTSEQISSSHPGTSSHASS
ncbi:hypothetical protein [Phaffia rhodozyma]|uniref:Uncharacterized protein n=1 Tax=Phaffia rhodozyma TaxID=264483 RepID=A0A0F7SMI1_PHARH|nr:hypothetical protein [Phaffia rhodozyma]